MENFVKIMKALSVIFMRKKEEMEKSKYWRRNNGFSFILKVWLFYFIFLTSPKQKINNKISDSTKIKLEQIKACTNTQKYRRGHRNSGRQLLRAGLGHGPLKKKK